MVNVGKYKIVTFLVSSEDKRPKSKTYRAFYNTRRRKMYEMYEMYENKSTFLVKKRKVRDCELLSSNGAIGFENRPHVENARCEPERLVTMCSEGGRNDFQGREI